MNKDAILATLIGFAIGLLITGVLLAGPSLLKAFPHITLPNFSFLNQTKKPATTPKPTPSTFALTIDSPIPDVIEENKDLLVSGTAVAGASVVIQGNTDDAVVVVKTDGKFAGKVTLSEGKNDITVTSYLKEEHATQTVTVYYTPDAL